MKWVLRLGLTLLWLASPHCLSALPDWVASLLKAPAGEFPSKANYAILLDETSIEVRPDGSETRTFRQAIRILHESGAEAARAFAWSVSKEDRFSAEGVWVLRDGRRYTPPKPPEWITTPALDSDTIRTESLKHTLSYTNIVRAGDIFAVEWIQKRTPLFATTLINWSAKGPIAREVVEIRLPPGWQLSATQIHGDNLLAESSGAGNVWRWSRTTPSLLPDEESAPKRDLVAASLLVRVTPASTVSGKWMQFESWDSCGRWIYELNQPSLKSTAALKNRANELIANRRGDAWAEMKAIAEFVQKVPYASVDEGLGLGLGFRAQPASLVLDRRLGDCKDKTALFQALCGELGYKTHMVITRIAPDDHFREEWPSPAQFDHAICAVSIEPNGDRWASLRSEKFGSLVFFDPTSEEALWGDLPLSLQNKRALIIGENSSELVRLPSIDEKHQFLTRQTARLRLDDSGRATGSLILHAEGAAGQSLRHFARVETSNQIKQRYTHRLTKAVKDVTVQTIEHAEKKENNGFSFSIDFTSPSYGQALPGRMLLIRLDVFGVPPIPSFPAVTRERGIERNPYSIEEEIEVELPEGVNVVEVPKDAELSSDFGSYRCRWSLEQGVLRGERAIYWRRINLPASRYSELKDFIGKVNKAHGSSILLRLP